MAWMLSLKVFLISTGVIFTALGLKVSVPLFSEFAASHVPAVWNFCLLCFKPPYLYLLINAIIIYIVASSRSHLTGAVEDHTEEPIPLPKAPPVEVISPPDVRPDLAILEFEPRDQELPVLEVKAVVEEEGDDRMESTWTSLKRMESSEIPLTEKPLVSARFGHRRPPRFTPEGGRSLRVAKQAKRHDTLENTWKMITEGRAMPLSRHMKKCDTWENRGPHEVKKSETFKERVNEQASTVVGAPSPMKLRKEPSLSQDELNRRVEAFIRKFNEEMRLQRQESLNQLMEMIHRGTH